MPILPFAGNAGYDSPARQQVRTEVNAWIRSPSAFDAVLPLDAAVSDGASPPRLLAAYDTGDALHLTPAGYEKLAAAVDLALF